MTACDVPLSSAIELYFYDELPLAERSELERHLAVCRGCREALADLAVIRSSLAQQPEVDAPAGGDWQRLMSRIERAIADEPARMQPTASTARPRSSRIAIAGLALAAAVTLITATAAHLVQQRVAGTGPIASRAGEPARGELVPVRADRPVPAPAAEVDAGLAAVSEQHFERSRLVILGLTTRDPRTSSTRDWAYERRLAGSLLEDTRLYKQAAADRGMTSLAGVMSDLELVLLQTSLADKRDSATLARLQRLIRKRDLVTRMDVAGLGERRPDLQVGRGER